jgi:hypothetical protein
MPEKGLGRTQESLSTTGQARLTKKKPISSSKGSIWYERNQDLVSSVFNFQSRLGCTSQPPLSTHTLDTRLSEPVKPVPSNFAWLQDLIWGPQSIDRRCRTGLAKTAQRAEGWHIHIRLPFYCLSTCFGAEYWATSFHPS